MGGGGRRYGGINGNGIHTYIHTYIQNETNYQYIHYLDESQKLGPIKEARHKKSSNRSHLYEIIEKPKLIYSDRRLVSDSEGCGWRRGRKERHVGTSVRLILK